MTTRGELPIAEFAFPGPLRDLLVAAILSGMKTATTSTFVEYSIENKPLPVVGARQLVVGSDGAAVAIIETTGVDVVRLADVGIVHARGEGEGYSTVESWRRGHEAFWHRAEFREFLGDPTFTVDDDTLVVVEQFRVILNSEL